LNTTPRQNPTFAIETYGCQMNVYDSNAMRGLLVEHGFVPTTDTQRADIVLINTCSVREHAEHRVISRVGELHARRVRADGQPAIVAICGCMAERLGAELLRNGRQVDLVVGVDQYDRLPDLLHALVANSEPPQRALTGHRSGQHYVAPLEAYPTNGSHLITIHKGCDYRCTYCIVPRTRGPQREKHPDQILTEIATVAAAGGQEVTLLGQNVTAYRWDDRFDFAGLLQSVARIDGIERIRFLTGHPRDMHDQLIEVIAATPQVCPWLHVPLQSGSDRVLRRMKRLYRRQDYLRMVDYARRVIPDVTFSSDFIVGFPGETEDDFAQSIAAVREICFDSLFIFKYSARPGTPAARLTDDVALAVKKSRLVQLTAVQQEVWDGIAAAQVDRVWTGVIEGPARKPSGFWRVRTANNRKVVVAGADTAIGEQIRVRVTGHTHTTFSGEREPD